MIKKGNIYSKPEARGDEPEIFEVLQKNDTILIEKITTTKAFKAPGEWYNQDEDEWVMLIRGEATLEFQDDEVIKMNAGDYLFIPSHRRHRVVSTSKNPNCIWLAIHGRLK